MRGWKLYLSFFVVVLFSFILFIPSAFSWGFYAHKRINHAAVYALSLPLEAFYKKHIDYIAEHAVDPDKRRYVDSSEGHRHFINIDHYGPKAFDLLPEYWNAAIEKYPKDTLEKYGTLPWEVLYWENKLTEAFKAKDADEILKASANIGHYIADAHVPLHTISNYDGQLSEQEGIHALWESAIPEAMGNKFNYLVGKAEYIKNPEDRIWEIVKETNALAKAVLDDEKSTSARFNPSTKYTDISHKKYSFAYIMAYNKALNGMVENQIRASVLDVASFWYTAWVNAGQPDVSRFK
jgi:hypothetical protein